ncbi:hypothetical protein VC83_03265 [Pseudogymnoascus destructans]|uniref:Uncharacterized protein n=1 Tax=Pseudogymnoascus destructans TaxID=655981 RepID=A0A177AG49_9PEZI|nr:uncharacterized protein VC83_03265 [Pseudogymnoascus destructans]OAF60382.1 hypothetical protein VC83_03265 [Pseudogymnoascus destructans]
MFPQPERTKGQERTDTMCFGRSANFNATAQKFNLGCDRRTLQGQEASRMPQLDDFRYWYGTGPRAVLNDRVVLDPSVTIVEPARNFTILVKREGSHNPWHSPSSRNAPPSEREI